MTTWMDPGHPGICPRCGAPNVRWTWKPDLEPTTERFRCSTCKWDLIRHFKGTPPMITLEWEDPRVAVIKSALNYWIGACEHKVKVVGERAAEFGSVRSDSGWSVKDDMPESLRADIEHINTMLPIRLNEAREALKDITSATRGSRGI